MPERVVRYKFFAFAEIDGVRHAVSSLVLHYALNKMPTASCTLASGADVFRNDAIRSIVEPVTSDTSIADRAPILIKLLRVDMDDPSSRNRSPGNPNNYQTVFDGYVSGTGYRRVSGAFQPVVHLTHWLDDLAASSVLHSQAHPANPALLRWRATFGEGGTQTEARTAFLSSHVSSRFFTANAITTDFWGEALHPMFCELAGFKILDDLGPDDCTAIQNSNNLARRALRRMVVGNREPLSSVEDCAGLIVGSYQPLSLQVSAAGSLIAKAISEICGSQSVIQYYNSTIWDKLVGEMAPMFRFAVVPSVGSASVIPLVPTLYSEDTRDLVFDRVLSISTQVATPRPLRGVGVLRGIAGSDVDALDRSPLQDLGGCYVPDIDADGLVMYRKPPPWLQLVPDMSIDHGATIWPDNPGSATTPVAFGITKVAEPGNEREDVETGIHNYYDALAEMIYSEESLRNRYAVVQAAFDMSFGPGSTVRVIPSDWANDGVRRADIPNSVALAGLEGLVSRVSVMLDANSAAANTVYQIDYLRPAKRDRSQADKTIDRHPLYETVVDYVPLLTDENGIEQALA